MHSCRGTGIPSRRQHPCVIVAWPFDALGMALTNSYPMRLMGCSVLAFGIGFVIRSAGFTLVSTFVANQPDLEASCIQRFCMSTCFALPSPLRLTRHTVAEASKCRISLHDIHTSFATLWILSPSEAVLTAAYSSLSADENATTCCLLVHTLREWVHLKMTPA